MSTMLAFAIVAAQAAAGAIWWILAVAGRRKRVSLLEAAGVGLALGALVSMLAGIALVSTPLAGVAWAVPVALTVPLALVARRRLAAVQLTAPGSQLVALALGLCSGAALAVLNWRRIPLDDPTAQSFTDLYFFEALGKGLAQWGPGDSILMSGGSLRYHWFTYAWAGQLEASAGTPTFMVLTRILPVVVAVGVSLIVASWAGRLSTVRWVPSLAVLLVVVGGYTGALYGTILNYDSPSQSMTTLWLLAFAVVFLDRVEDTAARWSLVLIAILASACVGGKVSHAAVAGGGAALVSIVGLILRQAWWRRALVASAVAAVAMAVTYLVVLAGVAVDRNLTEEAATKASTWQGLDPFEGRLGVALGTAALVLAILARLAGIAWLAHTSAGRREPELLFASGGLLVGLAAMLVLSEGVNELWFVLAASAPAAVLSAHGVGEALRASARTGLRRPLLLSLVVAAPASLATLVLTRNWTEHRALINWLASIAAWLIVPLTAAVVAWVAGRRGNRGVAMVAFTIAGLVMTSILTRPASLWTSLRPVNAADGVIRPTNQSGGKADLNSYAGGSRSFADAMEAAEWVAANVPPGDLVATGWPLSALVPALSGRQMFIAGNIYQAGLGASDEVGRVWARSEASLEFASVPGPDSAATLCLDGVKWVWMDTPITTIPGVAEIVYSNATTTIMRLLPGACS